MALALRQLAQQQQAVGVGQRLEQLPGGIGIGPQLLDIDGFVHGLYSSKIQYVFLYIVFCESVSPDDQRSALAAGNKKPAEAGFLSRNANQASASAAA
ncbi:conserved protein of unknown function [Ectopseudomonas oleovorans]|uniref:Uncharacterized protein n=1 Tax=Ectopseudomonas oleovorans TaxID=301 RepID=A0A653B591_ECTOL|nr:conserved protein of unknown function [Pseudomonas oleovorans]